MILGKYNQSKTIPFSLIQPDGINFEVAAIFAAGDIVIMTDEGTETNATNLPTDEGIGYSLVLTAAEMSAARITIYIIDQTATKVWLDSSINLETYGDVSSEHGFDLDSSNLAASASTIVRGIVTGTPTTTTMSASALTETTNNHYNGRTIIWNSGTLKDQATSITGYDGITRTFTFSACTEAATANDTFVIL